MEAKRIGGALLSAVAVGVGIIVPYTLDEISPPMLAVIWAVLVFGGVMGLVLALHPGGGTGPAPQHSEPKPSRKPLIDPELRAMLAPLFIMGAFMVSFFSLMIVLQLLMKAQRWVAAL